MKALTSHELSELAKCKKSPQYFINTYGALRDPILGKVPLKGSTGTVSIELNEFRKFNINPVKNDQGKTEQKNYGPNFTFKVRDEAGQAREFINYMSPIPLDGRLFMMSGVREAQDQEFRYLHIPVDESGSLERFMTMRARLLDTKYINKLARLTVDPRVTFYSVWGDVFGWACAVLAILIVLDALSSAIRAKSAVRKARGRQEKQ